MSVMSNNMKKRTSTSYIFTANVYNPSDMHEVELLKKSVSVLNSSARLLNPGAPLLRVCLKARLGKNNPKAVNYRRGGNRRLKTYTPYQSILIKDASRVDVYLYTR